MPHVPGAPKAGHEDTSPGDADEAIDFGKGTVQQDKDAIAQEFAPDPFAWTDLVSSRIALSMGQWGIANGVDLDFIEQKYVMNQRGMFDALYGSLLAPADSNRNEAGSMAMMNLASQQEGFNREAFGTMGMGSGYFTSTFQGMEEMVAWAMNWMGGKVGMDLQPFVEGGGGGRGSGARTLTAEEIRNMFDLDELAKAVNDMNRGLVLEDHNDAKGLARKYVDAIVATGAEKEIDFETFVRNKIEATARFKNIYKRKPESVSAEAYMAPYLQAAMQMASPGEAAAIAIGGAQFGASAESFRQRLNRTDNVTGSSPFINALEGRMNNLNAVLRG